MSTSTTSVPAGEPLNTDAAGTSLTSKLNWLRAGVLGANDGILSTAGLVMGVAGASTGSTAVLVAGLAGVVAGALSMAGGEYVSVSSQRDTELAVLAKEKWELENLPEQELDELANFYVEKGLDENLARQVAIELTEHDALRAHAEVELGIDVDEHSNPWEAAFASLIAFTVGGLIPLLLIVLSPMSLRVVATLIGVCVALLITGFLSATLGGGPNARPMIRNVVVGALAMGVTYGLGHLVGQHI